MRTLRTDAAVGERYYGWRIVFVVTAATADAGRWTTTLLYLLLLLASFKDNFCLLFYGINATFLWDHNGFSSSPFVATSGRSLTTLGNDYSSPTSSVGDNDACSSSSSGDCKCCSASASSSFSDHYFFFYLPAAVS